MVFIDYQNVYKGAREAFGKTNAPGVYGQIDPQRLGQEVVNRYEDRALEQVRVYRGRPSQLRDPYGYAASQRQLAAWQRMPDVKPVIRDLRYPPGWPDCADRPQEKGIDVALAVDFVRLAIQGRYDIGVIFSADTDLKPAMESVLSLDNPPKVEVAAWGSTGGHASRLRLPDRSVWCQYFGISDYESIRDTVNYSKST